MNNVALSLRKKEVSNVLAAGRMTGWMEPLAPWLGVGASAGGGYMAVRWFLEWISGRYDKRSAQLDAATERLIKALEDRIDALTARLTVAEEHLDTCKREHEQSRAKVLELEAMFLAQGEAKKMAAGIVAIERNGRVDDE